MDHRLGYSLTAAIVLAVATMAAAPPASAQQKTAKQCTEEWRANKAGNQAKHITEKAYVAQCRSGTAAAQPVAPPTAPTARAPAPPTAPTARAPAQAPRANRTTTGAAPAGANQFASESQARARCVGDTVVWVNESSKIYHFSGTKAYGTTKQGAYMCERDAMAAGDRAAKNEKHP